MMSRTVYTANFYHLGDNLIFLHLLRALAKSRVSTPFVHFCHAHLIPQLVEAVQDLPNIMLEPFESALWYDHGHRAIDTWKNSEGFWERSPNRWDWSAHTLEHHAWTARRMGMESPFTCREHLLFDYPAIENPVSALGFPFVASLTHDFLIGDSAPNSGQYKEWADHSQNPIQQLIDALRNNGKTVLTTSHIKEIGGTISCAGTSSFHCRHHIMVPNGPFWPTLNTTNHHHREGRRRIVLLDNGEQINMPHITQCASVAEVMEIAKEEDWV